MGKFIRNNLLDNYSADDDGVVRPVKKKKVKKLKDLDDQKYKPVKKN